jgi:hypothetical protein
LGFRSSDAKKKAKRFPSREFQSHDSNGADSRLQRPVKTIQAIDDASPLRDRRGSETLRVYETRVYEALARRRRAKPAKKTKPAASTPNVAGSGVTTT